VYFDLAFQSNSTPRILFVLYNASDISIILSFNFSSEDQYATTSPSATISPEAVI